MKATLTLLVHMMALCPAQVDSLPTTLPAGQKTPGLKVPLAEPNPAGLAAPTAPAEEAPQVTPPLVVPSREPKVPAALTAPADEPKTPAGLAGPPPPPPPSLPDTSPDEVSPPRAEPYMPCPPTPWSCAPSAARPCPVAPPAGCACRQNAAPPPWGRRTSPLRTAGPAAGYFVVQDVHGAWPVGTADLPMPSGPPPLVRASSHPLPPAATVMPVIYTSRSGSPEVAAPKTEPPAAPPEKVVIVQTRQAKEIAWGAQDEYRKIVGQLVRVHVHGGRWVVRYAGLDKEDRYGGSVVLDPASDLGRLIEGDVVCVQGEILNGGRAERPFGAPLYRVQSLRRLAGGND